ncbi:MAG: diguanylate cyclase [Porticoccaceae bacterium]
MKQWIIQDNVPRHLPLETLVLIDKLQLLYRQSFTAVYASFVIAAMLTAILWDSNQAPNVLNWFLAIAVVSVIRLILFAAYFRILPDGVEIITWKLPYIVTLTLSSLVWGVGLLIVMPKDSLLYQTIVYYFLMGMSGGALSVYYAIRSFILITLAVMLAPMTLWMLMQGEFAPVLMAMAALVYLVSAMRATNVLSSALQQSFLLTHELKVAKEDAENIARTDALTGLSNRRAFMELAEHLITLCKRSQQPVALIILDLDHFKRINDTYGHAMGDLVLQHTARIIESMLRESDICARLGGEEFAVLMPNTSHEGGRTVAEKLCQAIEGESASGQLACCKITASLGVVWSKKPDLEAMLLNADKAMYRAKQMGRNRVFAGD